MIDQEKVRFGSPVRSFRIKRRSSWVFLFLSAVTAAAIMWGLVLADAPVCTVVPLFVLGWITLEFFIKRRTELRVYDNGLEYQRLFRRHAVLWEDIEEFGHILRSDYEEAELKDLGGKPVPKIRSIRGGGDHVWLQTFDGEKFYLRPDLEEMKEIINTISGKLFGAPYYEDEPDEVYTSRKIIRRDIDA